MVKPTKTKGEVKAIPHKPAVRDGVDLHIDESESDADDSVFEKY